MAPEDQFALNEAGFEDSEAVLFDNWII